MNISGLSVQSDVYTQTKHVDNRQKSATQQQASQAQQPDETSISKEALEKLDQSKISEKATELLKNQGEKLFRSLFSSPTQTFREDLASRLDNETDLTTEQRSELANKISQREHEAFGKYAKQSPPDLEKYYENYVEYLDSLSPEERNSDRYKGQRALAIPLYETEAKNNGNTPKDFDKDDPILTLFEALERNDFNVENKEALRGRFLNSLSISNSNTDEATNNNVLNTISREFDQAIDLITKAKEGNKEAYQKLVSFSEATQDAN